MLTHERPFAPTVLMPAPVRNFRTTAPALLPSLADALRHRASIFGPVEVDPVPAATCGPWQAIGEVVRRVVSALVSRAAA